MRHTGFLGTLLLILAACAPVATPLPPEQPLVFNTTYENLFDSTLQAITTTHVRHEGRRFMFAIEGADRDTGIVRAYREGRPTGGLQATKRFGDDRSSLSLSLFVPLTAPERSTITVVIRPLADGRAALTYSVTAPTLEDTRLAERFMARVVQRLETGLGGTPGTTR
jgi:hypothetical protein